jgi:hypothetical protein
MYIYDKIKLYFNEQKQMNRQEISTGEGIVNKRRMPKTTIMYDESLRAFLKHTRYHVLYDMLLDAYIFHYLEKPKTPINKHDELKSPIGGRAQPICIFTSSHGPVTIFNDPISPEEFFLVPEKAKKEQRKRKTTNQVALPQKKITSGKEAHEQDNNDIHKHDEELRQRSKGRVKQERKVRDKPKETNRAKKKICQLGQHNSFHGSFLRRSTNWF